MEESDFESFFREVYSFFFEGKKISYCNPSFVDFEKLKNVIRDIADGWMEEMKSEDLDILIELDMSMSHDLLEIVCPAIKKVLVDSNYNNVSDKLYKIINKYFHVDIND